MGCPPPFRSHLRLRAAASTACPPATEREVLGERPCPTPHPPCPRHFQKNRRRTRRDRERREEHPFLRPSPLPGVSELISFGSRSKSVVKIKSPMFEKRNRESFGLLPVSGRDGAKPFSLVQKDRTSGLPIQRFRATASASILPDFILSFSEKQRPNQRPEGTPGKCPVLRNCLVPGVPHP
jgi:hypothetical protein